MCGWVKVAASRIGGCRCTVGACGVGTTVAGVAVRLSKVIHGVVLNSG
jgi:hypothetical protein